MRVGVERDSDRAVPQPLGNNLGTDTSAKQLRGVSMPEVVKPQFHSNPLSEFEVQCGE